ncbi:MAG: sodium:calcium antiporter [Candidatus Altiarchaeia archaeon]
MIETFLILLLSVLVVGKSAQIVIDSSLNLARFFRISEAALGFLVLSVATSLPELVVCVIASLDNEPAISLGTLIGSNIADIAVVLGLTLLLSTINIPCKDRKTYRNMLAATSIIPLFIYLNLGRFLGVLLLAVFMVYAYYMLHDRVSADGNERVRPRKAVISAFMFSAGVLLLIGGSNYAVDSAVTIASFFGISKIFIAATTLALGTSLPELAVNLTAVKKKHYDLAIGNVLGSCFTNLTLVLGISAVMVSPVARPGPLLNLIIFQVLTNAVLVYFMHYRKSLGKREGFFLLGIYLIFLVSAIIIETG